MIVHNDLGRQSRDSYHRSAAPTAWTLRFRALDLSALRARVMGAGDTVSASGLPTL